MLVGTEDDGSTSVLNLGHKFVPETLAAYCCISCLRRRIRHAGYRCSAWGKVFCCYWELEPSRRARQNLWLVEHVAMAVAEGPQKITKTTFLTCLQTRNRAVYTYAGYTPQLRCKRSHYLGNSDSPSNWPLSVDLLQSCCLIHTRVGRPPFASVII